MNQRLSPPVGNLPKPIAKKRRRVILTGITFCALAIVGVLAGSFYKQLNHLGGKGGAKALVESLQHPREQFPADRSRVNILLLGKDYDHNAKGIQFTGGEGNGTGSRTDSIVVASLDLDRKTVSLLSIPRDTRVVGPDGKIGKINAIYRNHGRAALLKTVTELLGVAPDHYIAVKPDSVKAIVDVLGGVEVEPLDFMKYDDNWAGLHIDLQPGKQRITGEQAVGFARFREVKTFRLLSDGTRVPLRGVRHSREEGDPRRMARQQQLIRAMSRQALSVSNLFQLDHIVEVGLSQLDTDLDRQQIFAIAALFRKVDSDTIVSGTLQGKAGIRGGTYLFRPDPEKTKDTVDWLLKGDERAANRLTLVQVINATEVRGAGRKVADRLKEEGFDAFVSGGSDVPEATARPMTRILYHQATYAARARRIAESVGGGTVEKDSVPQPADDEGYEHQRPDVVVILKQDVAPHYAMISRR